MLYTQSGRPQAPGWSTSHWPRCHSKFVCLYFICLLYFLFVLSLFLAIVGAGVLQWRPGRGACHSLQEGGCQLSGNIRPYSPMYQHYVICTSAVLVYRSSWLDTHGCCAFWLYNTVSEFCSHDAVLCISYLSVYLNKSCKCLFCHSCQGQLQRTHIIMINEVYSCHKSW